MRNKIELITKYIRIPPYPNFPPERFSFNRGKHRRSDWRVHSITQEQGGCGKKVGDMT